MVGHLLFLNALFRIIVVNNRFTLLQGYLHIDQALVAASAKIEFFVP